MSVAQILEQMAANAGRAQLQRGQLIGDAVSGLAHLPGQIVAERQRQQIVAEQRARQQGLDELQRNKDARAEKDQTLQDVAAERAQQRQQVLQRGVAAGFSDDPHTFNLDKAVAQVTADGQPDLALTLRDVHAKFQPTLTSGAAGSVMRDERGQVVPGSEIPEKPPAPSAAGFAAAATDPKATPEARAAAKAALDAVQQTPGAAETARHNQAMEAIGRLTAGRTDAAQRETARHNKAMETTAATAADPFGLHAPPNGAAAIAAANLAPTGTAGGDGPRGEDFLKTLAPGMASEVKAYAEGRRPFPTGMSYAKLQPMIQLVGQYDPTFDAANYTARAKARTDLTSPNGTGGKTINSLNTAIQHAGKLSDLIEQLDNFETPMANTLVNPIRTALGSTKVTNYDTVAPQLAKEIERAWRGSGGTAGEIHDLIETIGHNKGKQQQREALQQFVELARGKLDSTEQQRDNIMGAAGKSVPVLFEQNQAILDRIATRAGKEATPAAGSPIRVGGFSVVVR